MVLVSQAVEASPRPRRAGDRRQQILDVAAQLFARSGFHGVTVDDLGAELGISGPALYHHFAGKETLLGEMLVSISEHLLAEGRRRVAAETDPRAALERLLAGHIDFALDRTELITVQTRELVHAPEHEQRQIRALQAEYVEVWVDVLLDINPQLDRQVARSAMHVAFGLMNSTPHSARVPRDTMAALLFEMAHGALDAACALS